MSWPRSPTGPENGSSSPILISFGRASGGRLSTFGCKGGWIGGRLGLVVSQATSNSSTAETEAADPNLTDDLFLAEG